MRLIALLLIAFLAARPALSQVADPDPSRFAEAIERFVQWDRQNSFPPDAVLFVGSSSIVGWQTAERFPGLPVINRGFGGSHISDVNAFLEQTVLRYDPALIVFYAGNNDVNSGKSPRQVLEDYQQFVAAVRARGEAAPILYISIHPSLARWEKWPEMKEANRLIEEYSSGGPNLHYVDISAAMLGDDGRPMQALFVADGLHLTEGGYDVWTPLVARAITGIRENADAR